MMSLVSRAAVACTGLAVVALLASGCAALQSELEQRRPTVEVRGARVAGLSFDEARLEVELRIDNPNPVGIELAGIDYDLALDGRSVLSGERDRTLAIPPDGARTLALPIRVPFADAAAVLGELGGRESLAYAVELGAVLDVPVIGRRRVPARAEGRLPVPSMPAIRAADLRLDSLDWSGARVVLELAVDNPNPFGFALERLDYTLRVEGTEWASAGAAPGTRVPAEGRATLALPFRLDFATVGREAYRLLRDGGSVAYALEGRARGATDGAAGAPFTHDFRRRGRVRLGGE